MGNGQQNGKMAEGERFEELLLSVNGEILSLDVLFLEPHCYFSGFELQLFSCAYSIISYAWKDIYYLISEYVGRKKA